jgi:hypothetical protein
MSQEDWDSELLVPAQGRLVYVGQGQCHFVHFHDATPGLLWPNKKKKKKKKKKVVSQPPVQAPPIGEDWVAEISTLAAVCRQLEDWNAEIAASL